MPLETRIQHKAAGRRIVLVGFGKEGQSSLSFLLSTKLPNAIAVADKNEQLAQHPLIVAHGIAFFGGADFESHLSSADFIIKSPGVKLQDPLSYPHLHSQTALFMEAYSQQIIGITGTKGKSTTATMAYRMLQACGQASLLVGNIGVPPFEAVGHISPKTLIVMELSAHQLEHIQHSCRYAILLNLMPEHLDYFGTTEAYYAAKIRLLSQQEAASSFRYVGHSAAAYCSYSSSSAHCHLDDDILHIEGAADLQASQLLHLHGAHHLENIAALIELAITLQLPMDMVRHSICHFRPLAHRQAVLGTKNDCTFINDSIATIPQATIAALKSFPKTTHLIAGGLDRGIKYDDLLTYLHHSKLKKVYFLGLAGRRMCQEYKKRYKTAPFDSCLAEKLHDIEDELITLKNACVLLSPAAASYDYFSNFEARGHFFENIFEKK